TEVLIYIYPRFFGLIPPTYWGHSPFWLSTTAFGIVPLLLVLTAVFFRFREKAVLFFVLLSVFILLMAFGGFTPIYKLLYQIPIINGFRNPSRWLAYFAFSMITLSAYGLDLLAGLVTGKQGVQEQKGRKAFYALLAALAGLSFFVYLGFSSDQNGTILALQKWEGIKSRFTGPYLGNYASEIFKMISEDMLKFFLIFSLAAGTVVLAIMRKLNKALLAGMLAVIFAADMLLFWGQFKLVEKISEDPTKTEILSFMEKQQNKGPYRVFPMGQQLSMSNWYMSEKIESIQGYHSAPLKNFNDMLQQGALGKLSYLGLLNVRYLLSLEKLNHPLLKAVHEGNVNIYESAMVFPRSFLAGEILALKGAEAIAKKFDDPKFNPIKTLILEEEVREKIEPLNINGSEVNIASYTPNKVVLTAKAPVDCMLVLGDIYYPEWEAFVDGKKTKIFQAYGALRAVHLTKGEHKVEFVYGKKIFYIGLLISLLTLAVIIGVFGFLRPKI
ncbi:MAG: YfhO family protein, partial [Candidatus Firestonebacteria bacterium]